MKARKFLIVFSMICSAVLISGCFKLFTARLTDPDHCKISAESAVNLVVECGSDEETATEVIAVDR